MMLASGTFHCRSRKRLPLMTKGGTQTGRSMNQQVVLHMPEKERERDIYIYIRYCLPAGRSNFIKEITSLVAMLMLWTYCSQGGT